MRLFGARFLSEFTSVLKKSGFSLEKRKGGRLFFGISNFGPPDKPLLIQEMDGESAGYKAGLRPKDVLLEVSGCTLRDASDLRRALQGRDSNESVAVLIRRGHRKIRMRIPWLSFETRIEIVPKDEDDIKNTG
jgi:S1-C subfamily serine protease